MALSLLPGRLLVTPCVPPVVRAGISKAAATSARPVAMAPPVSGDGMAPVHHDVQSDERDSDNDPAEYAHVNLLKRFP